MPLRTPPKQSREPPPLIRGTEGPGAEHQASRSCGWVQRGTVWRASNWRALTAVTVTVTVTRAGGTVGSQYAESPAPWRLSLAEVRRGRGGREPEAAARRGKGAGGHARLSCVGQCSIETVDLECMSQLDGGMVTESEWVNGHPTAHWQARAPSRRDHRRRSWPHNGAGHWQSAVPK